jgi:hypothetical protein
VFLGNDRSRVLHFYGDRFLRLRVADYFPYLRYALYNIIVNSFIFSLLRSLSFFDSLFYLFVYSFFCFFLSAASLVHFLFYHTAPSSCMIPHMYLYFNLLSLHPSLYTFSIILARTYFFCAVLLLNVQQAKSQCGTSLLLSRSLSMTSCCATWQPMSLLSS